MVCVYKAMFMCGWWCQFGIAVYSIIFGDARRMLYGVDSFGNICGQQYNSPVKGVNLSGRNTLQLP